LLPFAVILKFATISFAAKLYVDGFGFDCRDQIFDCMPALIITKPACFRDAISC
jgi:hypothetical protein